MNISLLKEKGSKYIVFILIGFLVLVMCIPTEKHETQIIEEKSDVETADLEGQLERVLTAMEGVGDVKVMITTEKLGDSVFGAQDSEKKVCGVVVVAEGAGNATVDARISDAVKALFSIDVHKISIVKMRSQEDRK